MLKSWSSCLPLVCWVLNRETTSANFKILVLHLHLVCWVFNREITSANFKVLVLHLHLVCWVFNRETAGTNHQMLINSYTMKTVQRSVVYHKKGAM